MGCVVVRGLVGGGGGVGDGGERGGRGGAAAEGERRRAPNRPWRRGCQRRVPVTAPAQACAGRSASSRAQTPTSPSSSPPFSASSCRLSYPEIKAMVIRVEGGGGLTDLKQPVLCA